jgi:hypothetical protein
MASNAKTNAPGTGCAVVLVAVVAISIMAFPFIELVNGLVALGAPKGAAVAAGWLAAAAVALGGFVLWSKRRAAQQEREQQADAARAWAVQQAADQAVIRARSRGPRPAPTLIRTYRDAETSAAAWMRWMGWGDAAVTQTGPDGGVDVIATRAVGQVKAHVNPIGRPEVQQLHGCAVAMKRDSAFFCLGGYTPQAVGWADSVEMPLFRFDLSGEPEPVNGTARRIMDYGAPGTLRAAR